MIEQIKIKQCINLIFVSEAHNYWPKAKGEDTLYHWCVLFRRAESLIIVNNESF